MISYYAVVTGSLTVNGDLIVTGTGSMSSSAAISSSYAYSASSAVSSYTASSAINASASLVSISSSYAQTSSYANTFTVGSTLTAQTLVVQTITSSIDYITGSARFGSSLGNTQTFTGSVNITGSMNVTGSSIFSSNVNAGGFYANGSTTIGIPFDTGGTKAYFDGSSINGPALSLVSDGVGRTIRMAATTGSTYVGVVDINTTKMSVGTNTALPLTFIYNASEVMRITSGGQLGIGTISPDTTLHVSSSAGIKIQATGNSDTPSLTIINYTNQYGWARFGGGLQGNGKGYATISSWNASTIGEVVRISGDGYVGINTTTPKASLEIAGLSSTNIRIFGITGITENGITSNVYWNGSSWLHDSAAISSSAIRLGQGGDILFNTDNSTSGFPAERMRIISTGNVGIGTTSPGYPLDVNGVINSNSTIQGSVFRTFTNTITVSAANTNYTWTGISNGRYLLSISSGATYHYNGILAVTLFDTADYGYAVLTSGNYQTTLTFSITPASSNHTLNFSFSQIIGSTTLNLFRIG